MFSLTMSRRQKKEEGPHDMQVLQDLVLSVTPQCRELEVVSHTAQQLNHGCSYIPHRFYSVHARSDKTVKLELPLHYDGDCPHCGKTLQFNNNESPVPLVFAHDTERDRYFISLAFCRPCCAYGYAQQCYPKHSEALIMHTHEFLQRFAIPSLGSTSLYVAPPRHYHQRYGGYMSDAAFYGTDLPNSLIVRFREVRPTLIPYTAFLEVSAFARKYNENNLPPASTTLPDMLPAAWLTDARRAADAARGITYGLKRPVWTKEPDPERAVSDGPPEYLEFLRQRGQELLASKQEKKKRKATDQGPAAPQRQRVEEE